MKSTGAKLPGSPDLFACTEAVYTEVTLTLQNRRIFKSSFPQSVGGNPVLKRPGCPTENFGHDRKDN
jgi:hypothetical protein